jgi:tRNA modification GTPase
MNESSEHDTIIALSTPLGYSGIGVIRLSGPQSISIAKRLFIPNRKNDVFAERKAIYGRFLDTQSGDVLDDGLCIVMRAPGSYTGEDTVEFNLHGSPFILHRALEIAVREGARLAKKGEFTLRAFLAGKLDLIQAESVIDIIEATSANGLKEARAGIDKSLSSEIIHIESKLKDVLATLEAHIDFDDDEFEEKPEISAEIDSILELIEALLFRGSISRMRRHGIKTVLVGKPNVGKSTLFNTLLKMDRMIVTPFPGTTRDPVDEMLSIGGICFQLSDTAGIRAEPAPIEEEGIRRTRLRMTDADLLLVVLDGSQSLDTDDLIILNECRLHRSIFIFNKSDLPQASISGLPMEENAPVIHLSAKTGAGLDHLEGMLKNAGESSLDPNMKAGLNSRCMLLLESAQFILMELRKYLSPSHEASYEIISLELRNCLQKISEITGKSVTDGILERIFSKFCVGK